MGRYKSVLMAQKDAREFPYHVEVPVPPTGLGKRLDIISDWLGQNVGPDWRQHGHLRNGKHTACYMFQTQENARLFKDAVSDGQL